MKIFLIAGKARSGKDETAKIIKKHLGKSVKLSFARYIKVYAQDISGWDGSDENKPRTLLNEIGDRLRKEDKFFLIKRIIEDINLYRFYFDNIIISDVRLVDEIKEIKKHSTDKVITIKLFTDELKGNLSDSERKHFTETELDDYNDFDYIIKNEYDESLELKIIEMLEEIK